MIFARRDDAGGAPLQAPLLVFLVDGYSLAAGIAQAADSALQAGFRTVVVPWFALSLGTDAMVAVAGFEALPDCVRRGIGGPETMRPDVIAVLADPPGLGRAARLAIDGLVNGSGAPVIAPLLDDAAAAPLPETLRAVLSFAPPHARPVRSDDGTSGDNYSGDDDLDACCLALARGALQLVLRASGDPARLLLAARLWEGGVRFGFTDTSSGIDLRLLRAWLAVARARCAPALPFLLPTPRFLAAAPAEPLHRAAAPCALDAAQPPGLPALAALLPSPAAGHVLVPTAARADAAFDFLDAALDGPGFADAPGLRRDAALLRHTARSIVATDTPVDDPLGLRLVEPGVGRAALVDHLAIGGRPELMDFTAVGIGRTPYSDGGFVDVGRAIDGLAALCRARHRRVCAARLEAAGCRAAPVVAIATLADASIDVPGVGRIPAAIAVRGFRCVLRVKQLDPIGCFHHSIQHAPLAHDFMTHPLWDRSSAPAPAPATSQALLMALEAYATGGGLSGLLASPTDPNAARARARRLQAMRLYAPMVLEMVRARLAVELGRDPLTEAPSASEYVHWFARSWGTQFIRCRRLRFLHDYHQAAIGRAAPDWLYTLGENNVTLLAEFADLDTGVFVDRYDAEHMDELFLSKADFASLSAGFAEAHARDVAAGRDVLRTLAFVALDGDPRGVADALVSFERAYAAAPEGGA